MRLNVVLVTALVLSCAVASAAPIAFSDRASFDAASGGSLAFESFEADFLGPSIDFGDFVVSEIDGNANVLNQQRNVGSLPEGSTHGTGSIFYDDNSPAADSVAEFVFDTPINAFALDVTADEGGVVAIGGNQSHSVTVSARIPKFFGVIDFEAPFSRVTFEHEGGPIVAFDALSYGTAPIPEPQTIVLLGLGLVGLAFARRRSAASRRRAAGLEPKQQEQLWPS